MILSWLESTGCKDFSLLIHGVIPILDAVGECLRFILFLDDLYGRMSDRVFPKGFTCVDFSKRTIVDGGEMVIL